MTNSELILLGAFAQKKFDMRDGFMIHIISEKYAKNVVKIPIVSTSIWNSMETIGQFEEIRMERFACIETKNVYLVGYGKKSNTLVVTIPTIMEEKISTKLPANKKASQMTEDDWILYRWEEVRTAGDAESTYIFNGYTSPYEKVRMIENFREIHAWERKKL